MEPTDEEKDFTRWLDGEFSEEEAARLLEKHPEWPEQAKAFEMIGNDLRTALEGTEDIPYADFFNHQVRNQIEGRDVFANRSTATESAGPETPEPAGTGAATFPLFARLRWLSAAGFLIVAGMLIALVYHNADPGGRTEIVSLYTPDDHVFATTRYDDEAAATVIHLEGLTDVPASTVFYPASYSKEHHMVLADPPKKGPLFYRFESPDWGRPVSVLSRDSADQMPGAILVGF